MKQDFLNAIKKRRSYYSIGKNSNVTQKTIKEIVEQAVLHTPSPFNAQSARTVVLFGKQHDKLWNITMEALRKIVPTEQFGKTEEKIKSFAAGFGSILYFEDMSVIENLQKSFPLYKENFPIWSLQSNGMLEFVIWTALELEGLGASLQHYNPLIDESVKKEWSLPEKWKLLAQMPFGKPEAEPKEKEFLPLEKRIKVFE